MGWSQHEHLQLTFKKSLFKVAKVLLTWFAMCILTIFTFPVNILWRCRDKRVYTEIEYIYRCSSVLATGLTALRHQLKLSKLFTLEQCHLPSKSIQSSSKSWLRLIGTRGLRTGVSKRQSLDEAAVVSGANSFRNGSEWPTVRSKHSKHSKLQTT